jgi:predicted PurR-regulated permease PerM
MNLKNKSGLIGKIFAVIGIIILIILLVIGITVYQAYSLVNTIKTETPNIESGIRALMADKVPDCSKIEQTENSVSKVYKEANSACKNPIIRISSENIEQIPIKCNQLSVYKSGFEGNMTLVKKVCENETIMNILKNQNI